MGNLMSQMWPPAPTLTESNLPSQKGKVFIITGGYSGIGLALATILYHAGGKVYIAGRSVEMATKAIDDLKAAAVDREGWGQLHFLELDLSDLRSIKPAVKHFLDAESRLDVLFNNAGVSSSPAHLRTAQGLELQMGSNAVGPYLLTELLRPLLLSTAKAAPAGTVRVVWTASISVEAQAPKGGFVLDDLINIPTDRFANYANSKVANVLLCAELAKQSFVNNEGIVHVAQNPGNLNTNLVRHMPYWMRLMARRLLFDASYGAYTALWAATSQEAITERGGLCYVIPWGRKHHSLRKDVIEACKSEDDGGTGTAEAFRRWCDEQVGEFR